MDVLCLCVWILSCSTHRRSLKTEAYNRTLEYQVSNLTKENERLRAQQDFNSAELERLVRCRLISLRRAELRCCWWFDARFARVCGCRSLARGWVQKFLFARLAWCRFDTVAPSFSLHFRCGAAQVRQHEVDESKLRDAEEDRKSMIKELQIQTDRTQKER
jgi:hypothetical protein